MRHLIQIIVSRSIPFSLPTSVLPDHWPGRRRTTLTPRITTPPANGAKALSASCVGFWMSVRPRRGYLQFYFRLTTCKEYPARTGRTTELKDASPNILPKTDLLTQIGLSAQCAYPIHAVTSRHTKFLILGWNVSLISSLVNEGIHERMRHLDLAPEKRIS
jgi:hypothetical protein